MARKNQQKIEVIPERFNRKLYNKLYDRYLAFTDEQRLSALILMNTQLIELQDNMKVLMSTVDQLCKDLYENEDNEEIDSSINAIIEAVQNMNDTSTSEEDN